MMGGMQDELSMIEQDLNMTRRATRPFVPSEDVGYFELQKQVHELETMPNTAIRPARFNADEFLSIEELPAPKKVQSRATASSLPRPAAAATSLFTRLRSTRVGSARSPRAKRSSTRSSSTSRGASAPSP